MLPGTNRPLLAGARPELLAALELARADRARRVAAAPPGLSRHRADAAMEKISRRWRGAPEI